MLGQGTGATANVAPRVRGRAPRPGAEIARGAKRVVESTQAPRDATRGRVLLAGKTEEDVLGSAAPPADPTIPGKPAPVAALRRG